MARRRNICAIAALAFVLAGCGGGGGGNSSDQIALAAAKTSKAGSIGTDFTVSGGGVQGQGSGVFNTGKKSSGRMTITVKVAGRNFKIDTVITGTVLYMRSPAFRQLTGGKQWVKLDLEKIARQRGIDISSLLNTSPTPTSALAYLGGSADVKKVGGEQVQGLDTTHYKVTVDLERAAAQAKGTARQSLKRLIQTTGVKKVPEDVWIDGSGFVRKVVYESAGGSGGQKVRVAMLLHDFGPRVPIQPPPKGSVVDIMNRIGG